MEQRKNMFLENVNIFFDMDGVLAEYVEDIERRMYAEGFFLNLPKMNLMVDLMNTLISMHANVYILSTCVDSPFVEKEKNIWLDKYTLIDDNHRIFVPDGTTKFDRINQVLPDIKNDTNILIDDYSENLWIWHNNGYIGIKCLNGVNSNFNSWLDAKLPYLYYNESVEQNLNKLEEIVKSCAS